MDLYIIFGVLFLIISAFILLASKFTAAVFGMGIVYGVILIFHKKIANLFRSIKRPLLAYGILVFCSGMLMEVLAILSNLQKIRAGAAVYLFSPNPIADLAIAAPHYLAVALLWVWVLKKYRLSPLEQGVLIGLFWGIVVDNLSHLRALISGNVLDFLIAGILMVFAFSWPLVILKDKIDEYYPQRSGTKTKYFIAFVSQIIPILVIVAEHFLFQR